MALEPGGRADKLGNEFERHWGALQLLRVLAGEAISVFPEGLGPDENGCSGRRKASGPPMQT